MNELARVIGMSEASILETFQLGALAFTRILVAISMVPFFGGKIVKQRVKMGIAFAIFLVLAPAAFPENKEGPPAFSSAGVFGVLLIKEAFIGFVIGFLLALVFHVVEAAGRFIDLARGASMAQVFAPHVGSQVSLFGQIYLQVTILIFLMVGGHYHFLRGLARSFDLIPIDEMPVFAAGGELLANHVITTTSKLFGIALQLAAPAAVATFVTDVFLGIANKVAPQVQVFFLGMPLKAMVGILMIYLVFSMLAGEHGELRATLGRAIEDMEEGILLLGIGAER